ncbi:MAG TPA: hypothetical protein VGG35_27995 [Streptosporangiaceae bacterium]
MRTEDDLRSALASLEPLAPDPQEVLAAIQREPLTRRPSGPVGSPAPDGLPRDGPAGSPEPSP